MKKYIILSLAIISVLLSSCSSTYFYSTLNTTNKELEKVDNGDFLYQTDSLWIAYCFKGEDAPIQITVFNKLDIPLYVDWQRSTLILNGTAYPYGDGRATFMGSTTSTSYGTGYPDSYRRTHGSVEGSVELPKHVSFIPPKTMVTHSSLRLAARFDEIKDKKYVNAKIGTANQEVRNIKRINYNNQNTPLRFESYITTYTNPNEPQAHTSNFHITHLIKTKVKPQDLPSDMAERGDTFYQRKEANNTGWHILAGTAIVAGTVAIDVMIQDDDYYYNRRRR